MSAFKIHRDNNLKQFDDAENKQVKEQRNLASFVIYLFLVLRLEQFKSIRADYTISNHQGDQRHVGEYASAEFP